MAKTYLQIFILLGALAGSISSFGAEPLKREVFGSVGVGLNYDDEGSIGRGITAGGGFGYRLSRRFGVEGEVNGFRTRREFSSVFPPFQANGFRAMGNGLLYLNRGPAQAYLLFGAGVVHVKNESGFGGIRTDLSSSGLNLGVGFGVKVFVNPHWSLRPEVRLDAGSPKGSIEAPFTSMRFSLGVGYHW